LAIEVNIVPYLLTARTMEPEKQALLVNGSETTFVSRQLPQKKKTTERFPFLGKNNGTISVPRQKIVNKNE
jgi:hypothetical protein